MTANLETRLQEAAEAHCPGLSLPRDLGLRLVAEVFASDGKEEARWIEATQNACPACGGSGHKGDCAAPLGDAVAEINFLRAELATADDRAEDAHAVGFAAGIEAAIASIMNHSNIARRRMAECYDELDPDGYNGWGDIVSHLDIELGAIRALTPPDITAAAARALLADDVALSKMAGAVHDGPLGADDYWFSAATPQGGWCVDVVRASLRALAEVKP